MVHPLRQLIATLPQRLAGQAEACVGGVGEVQRRDSALWKQRILLSSIAIGLAVCATLLGGAALLLWAMVPAARALEPWLLFAAPAVPAILAVWCAAEGRRENVDLFADFEQQIGADFVMLREASGT